LHLESLYIHVYVYVYIYVCTYTYTFTLTTRPRQSWGRPWVYTIAAVPDIYACMITYMNVYRDRNVCVCIFDRPTML